MSEDEKILIHGLEIRPSQFAQDLLAAFHLGAQTALAAAARQSPDQSYGQGQPSQVVNYGFPADNDEPVGEVTLPDLMGMDPLRREALLSSYGLTVAVPETGEPDPTAANLLKMMESDGVFDQTKPKASSGDVRYEPTDEGDGDDA